MCQLVGLRTGGIPSYPVCQPQDTHCLRVSLHPVACAHRQPRLFTLAKSLPRALSFPDSHRKKTLYQMEMSCDTPLSLHLEKLETLSQWHLTWDLKVVYRKTPER